jgi:hypothetical protein
VKLSGVSSSWRKQGRNATTVQERAGEGGDQVRKFTSWGARAYPHASEIIGQNIMCQLTVRRRHRSTHGLKRDCHEPGSRGIKPGMIAPFRRIASSPSREEGVPQHANRPPQADHVPRGVRRGTSVSEDCIFIRKGTGPQARASDYWSRVHHVSRGRLSGTEGGAASQSRSQRLLIR